MKGKSFENEETTSESKFTCLPKQTYYDQIVEEGGILTFEDVDGSNTNVKPLCSLSIQNSGWGVHTP